MNFFKSSTGIILTIVAVVLVVGTILMFTGSTPPEELPPMGQEYPEAGRAHIADGTAATNYNSNPPTSGDHYATPAQEDFYDVTLPDERLVHNLEHGQTWISYKSSVDQATKDEIRAIQGRNPRRSVASVRDANPQNICLASWTRLLCMDTLDVEVAEQFIDVNMNRAPEPLAR